MLGRERKAARRQYGTTAGTQCERTAVHPARIALEYFAVEPTSSLGPCQFSRSALMPLVHRLNICAKAGINGSIMVM